MTFYLTCSQFFYRSAVLVDVTIVQRQIGGTVSITFALNYYTIHARMDLRVAAGTVKCMF